MYGDAMMAAQAEHRLRERTYRREMTDPELAWCADERFRAAIGVDLGPLTRAARTLILAVASLF
jgi:hypothetical protein